MCDTLVMVQTPKDQRIERMTTREDWDSEELEKRESFQTPLTEKESAAHIVIDNSGGMKDLRKRVEVFFASLKK